MRIWHFELRNIRRYAAYLGHCIQHLSINITGSIREPAGSIREPAKNPSMLYASKDSYMIRNYMYIIAYKTTILLLQKSK